MTNSSTFAAHLRDELELRRRHLLNEFDRFMDEQLHGRVAEWRLDAIVAEIGVNTVLDLLAATEKAAA
jgi:hypothetical protein